MENNGISLDDIFNKVNEIENNRKSNVKLGESVKETEVKIENVDLDKEQDDIKQETSDQKTEKVKQELPEKETEFENLKKH